MSFYDKTPAEMISVVQQERDLAKKQVDLLEAAFTYAMTGKRSMAIKCAQKSEEFRTQRVNLVRREYGTGS